MKKIKVGSKVAFNTLEDAIWFDVLEIHCFWLTVREAGHENYAKQSMDRSLVKQVR